MVSVIIPVYNAEKYLTQCLQSVAEQTYRDLQVIVIDDGSTDGSLLIAEAFAAKDGRFAVLKQKNSGQAAARNRGLEKATGEYICFVDADDFLDSDYIQTLVGNIGDKDVLQTGYIRTDENGVSLFTRMPRHFYQFTVPWARLYRRDKIHNLSFSEGMIYEDVVFSMALWSLKPSYTIMPYKGYHYRRNSLSTTAKRNRPAERILFDRVSALKAPIWLKLYTKIRLKLHFSKKYNEVTTPYNS